PISSWVAKSVKPRQRGADFLLTRSATSSERPYRLVTATNTGHAPGKISAQPPGLAPTAIPASIADVRQAEDELEKAVAPAWNESNDGAVQATQHAAAIWSTRLAAAPALAVVDASARRKADWLLMDAHASALFAAPKFWLQLSRPLPRSTRMTSLARSRPTFGRPICASYWRIASTPQPGCQFVRSAEACDAESPFSCARVPDVGQCPLYLAACRNIGWLLPICNSGHYSADNSLLPVAHGSATTSAGVTSAGLRQRRPRHFPSSLAAVLRSDSGDASLALAPAHAWPLASLLPPWLPASCPLCGPLSGRSLELIEKSILELAMERPLLKDLVFYLAPQTPTSHSTRSHRGRDQPGEGRLLFLGLYLAFVVVTLLRPAGADTATEAHPHGAAIGVNSPADQLTAAQRAVTARAGRPLLHSYVADELQSGRVGVSSSGSVGALPPFNDACCTPFATPSNTRLLGEGQSPQIHLFHVNPNVINKSESNDCTTSTAPSWTSMKDEDDVENVAEFRGGRATPLSADVAVSRSLQSVDLATRVRHRPPPPPWLRWRGGGFSADSSLLVQLARRLAPIDLLAKAPCLLPLSLAVPSSTTTSRARLVRPLNCLQLAVGPLVCLLASGLYSVPVPTADSQVLLHVHLALPCWPSSPLWPLCKSETDRPPVWHDCLAWHSGVLLNVSKATLGLTLLAWGNSVGGDLISNVALARRGYPRMAISACFGGPMFKPDCCCWPGIERAACGCLGDRLDFVLLLGAWRQSVLHSGVLGVRPRFSWAAAYAIVLLLMYAAFLTLALL
uniref:Na_Ca_ex domain-containing protein n=1 Tax=Macrostomum lignano TaxID=282301 RepID=A0A1I8JQD6_9PLAT